MQTIPEPVLSDPRFSPARRARATLLAAVLAIVPVLAGAPALAQQGSDPPPASQSDASDAGEQPGADLPSADELFGRHLKAIGGKEAIEKHRNRVIEGTVSSQRGDFFAMLTVWTSEGNRLKRRIESPGRVTRTDFFSGTYGWRELADGRMSIVAGKELVDLAQAAEYKIMLDYETSFPRRKTMRETEIEGEPVYVVETLSRYRKPLRLFFHRETGLLVMMETTRQGEQEEAEPVRIHFKDYEEIDGVKYSMKQIQQSAQGTQTIVYDSLRTNIEDFPEIEPPDEVMKVIRRLEERARQQNQGTQGGDQPRPDPPAPPDVPTGGNGNGGGG